jgi:L-2,4-diaminobutyrate decarboxylase
MVFDRNSYLHGPARTSSEALDPLAAFASPDALDPQLQRFLEEACASLCRWFGTANQRSPLPSLRLLPDAFPETEGLGAQRLLDDLQQVMDGAYQPSHPGALAHLDPPPNTASIAAELICAGLNNNLLAEELSPSLSQLERQLCEWFASCFDLPMGSGGVAASGGTLSNLTALVTARHSLGLNAVSEAVVLTSDDAHVSLAKACRVMGLNADALRRIPVDASGCLRLDALQHELNRLAVAKRPCLAVVATAGTTVRGAIDPLRAIAEIVRNHGTWLHVDGAIGAVFALSGKTRELVDGLEEADSITVNPQKLLGIAKTSSLLLVRDQSTLHAAFGTGLPYMEPATVGAHGGEIGLQGSRPAEILKLWLGLRQLGMAGINSLLSNALARRERLQQSLDSQALDVVSGPLHLLACAPKNADADQCDRWSAQLRQRLLDEQIMVSRPCYRGRHHIKVVLGNPHTSDALIKHLGMTINQSIARNVH